MMLTLKYKAISTQTLQMHRNAREGFAFSAMLL